jgi:phosphoribosylamine---glycine ligase
MKVLVIERTPDGALDLAWRAAGLGHDVRYFCATYDQHKNPVGRGIVEREADFARGVRWAELIVAGGNDFRQRDLDMLRRDGKLVVGSSAEAAEWESDRSKGMAVLRRVGIPVPAYREFTDYDTAIAYIKKQGRPFVSKPSGHCDDKSLSYVAKSPADLIYMLERWKRAGKRTGQAFILQEKIAGVEVSAGAWFGPDGFVEDWETNFEHKKLMAGNLGPNTGEMGSVSFWSRKSKLARQVLKPLETELHRAGFVGCVDVNCLVDEDGTVHPLEFTTRGGWPALNLEASMFSGDFVEFFADLARGKPPKTVHRMDEVVLGVVIAIPDFPYSHATRKEVIGVPIYGLTPRNMGSIHPAQMMAGEAPDDDGKRGPCCVTAGDYVLIVTGSGATVQAARRSAYATVRQIEIPASPFHRNDIGARLAKDLPRLHEHGFAEGIEY